MVEKMLEKTDPTNKNRVKIVYKYSLISNWF